MIYDLVLPVFVLHYILVVDLRSYKALWILIFTVYQIATQPLENCKLVFSYRGR